MLGSSISGETPNPTLLTSVGLSTYMHRDCELRLAGFLAKVGACALGGPRKTWQKLGKPQEMKQHGTTDPTSLLAFGC